MGFFYNGGVEIMFALVFVLMIAAILFVIIKEASTWNKNNHAPRLSVRAEIVSKRADVQHHRHANGGDASGAHGHHMTTSTTYYVTFQVESGDRMELRVKGSEYGLLCEGDSGKLSFQGTRFLDFARD